MGTRKYHVFEWTIKNISFWNEYVHTEEIESPGFYFEHFRNVDLHPRGFINSPDDPITIFISAIQSDFNADLIFIGPDGSVISTNQVNGKKDVGCIIEGPKLEDVVALKGEDQLTLRFSFPSECDLTRRMCTTLDVTKASVRVDPEFIEKVGTESSEYIYFVSYTENKDIEGLVLQTVRTQETVELVLDTANKGEKNISVKCLVCLLKGEKVVAKHDEKEYVFRDEEPWSFSDEIQVKELVDKGLTILIDVKIINGNIIDNYNHLLHKDVTIEPVSFNRHRNSATSLKRDFTGLHLNSEFSDFQLVCDSVTFPVHRNILSARSPFFKAMFFSDMKEADSGCMDVVDMDSSTLASFLEFLYSGEVKNLKEESAFKLYYAADKYLVPTLKNKCAQFLGSNISILSVCDILLLADRHQDENILTAVHNFILNHIDEVSRSEEWKSFTNKHPILAAEVWDNFSLCAGETRLDKN